MKRALACLILIITLIVSVGCAGRSTAGRSTDPKTVLKDEFLLDIASVSDGSVYRRSDDKISEEYTAVVCSVPKDKKDEVVSKLTENYSVREERFASRAFENALMWFDLSVPDGLTVIYFRAETGTTRKTVPVYVGLIEEDDLLRIICVKW